MINMINITRAYVTTKNNEVFRLLGTGYLMSLLSEESQKKGTFVQFELYAKDTKSIRFHHGGQNNAHLRELLLYINNVLNNRNFDIRLHPTDLDTEYQNTTALKRLFFEGVKNTKSTTLDGDYPVVIRVTAPTVAVPIDSADSNLNIVDDNLK